jgi:hypothetical protein
VERSSARRDGDLDRAPDARGHLVAADGRITMSGAACG